MNDFQGAAKALQAFTDNIQVFKTCLIFSSPFFGGNFLLSGSGSDVVFITDNMSDSSSFFGGNILLSDSGAVPDPI
jgi:hypothetical protein